MRIVEIKRGLNFSNLGLVCINKIVVFSDNFPLLFELLYDIEHASDTGKLAFILRSSHNQFPGPTEYPLLHSRKFEVLRVRIFKNRNQ